MYTKNEAYQKIEELTIRFGEQIVSYKNASYNETLVRRDFIDPFFKALGWDVDNSQGYAEAYREVIHEDKIKVGSATKAPDYSFRLPGGKRLFFVEAKKPSIAVKTDIVPAYQVRRYAWSAKLPISLLTDFEELAVYDCNKKPKPEDKASIARIKYLTYKDYLTEFEFLWNTFSKERVLKGSFDQYIAGDNAKRGTTTVDKDFLQSLDDWRIQLAQNIALRNEAFTEDELNYTVQQTLDRIIFLRIAEDRGVEEYGRMKTALKGDNFYASLFTYFKEADEKYNSGLFDFKRDKLSRALVIDNKVVKSVITDLYYPASPYEFSVLSVEILGSAYEQFLGKQIKLSSRHKAEIEEKPEVRKAGGVYYTPQYIVEYIVAQTVGKLVEGKTPEAVAKLTIVDPACGSGSFLIGAYQFLLNWHLEYYKPDFIKFSETAADTTLPTKGREAAIKQRSKLPLTPDGNLTTALKKKILTNNIFGVDIDTQAVEVTKLSLLLKCMEGETQSSMTAEMSFGERVLPTLDNNIKSGNSLIDLDFYDGEFDFEPGAEKKIKPFSWQQAFPTVFKAGGFDTVIGNPPYGASLLKQEISYLSQKFPQTKKFLDSYCIFTIKTKTLLKPNGKFGLIVPNTFCDLESCNEFREWLLLQNKILILYQTGWAFKDAIVDTLVFIAENRQSSKNDVIQIELNSKMYSRQTNEFYQSHLHKIDYRNTEDDIRLLEKTKNIPTLSEVCAVKAGVKVYEKGKGAPPQTEKTLAERPFTSLIKHSDKWLPLFRGEDVNRYKLNKPKEFIHYGQWLAAPRSEDLFQSPKILMRRTDDKLRSCIESDDSICVNSCHVIKINQDKTTKISYSYLLALLNSKLLQKVFELQNPQMTNKIFSEIKVIYVERLPIMIATENNNVQKNLVDEIVKQADTILQLIQQKQQTNLLPEKLEQLQQRIIHIDSKINKLVYELYELSEEEIQIVQNT